MARRLKKMDLRVLLASEERTVKFAWVRHAGDDVYTGVLWKPGHFAYHASGEFHFKKKDGLIEYREIKVPLRKIVDAVPLFGVRFAPSDVAHFTELPAARDSRANTILCLDTASMPNNREVEINFGLLEAGRIGELAVPTNVKQVAILSLSLRYPWAYVTVGWGNM